MYANSGIKLLGFKDRSELRFEDNVKHSLFIYPDEMVSIPNSTIAFRFGLQLLRRTPEASGRLALC